MTLSQEIVIKLCEMYTKTHIYEIWFQSDHIQQICNESENYDN